MRLTIISNDKDLARYYSLHWRIGILKRFMIEDDERMLIRLKTYEDEFRELKKKLKARGL